MARYTIQYFLAYILTWRVTDTIQYAFHQYLVRNRAAYSLSVIRLPIFMMLLLYYDLICLCYYHRGRKRPMRILVVSKSYKIIRKGLYVISCPTLGWEGGEHVGSDSKPVIPTLY
jgi:hypothetical protein